MVDQNDQMSEVTATAEAPEVAAESGPTPDAMADFAGLLEKHGGAPVEVESEESTIEAEADAAPVAEKGPEGAAEPEKKEQPAKVNAKVLERAQAALKRAKAPQSMLDQLDDPEQLTFALELAGQQAEVDRRLSQPRERVSGDAEESGAESAQAERPGPTPVPDVEPFDFAAAAKPLEDHLDREGTEALASFVKGASESMRQQVEAQAQAMVVPLQQQLAMLQADLTLREMEATWPQLADKEQRDAVRAKAGMLAATGAYSDEAALFSDACKLALDDQSEDDASSRTLELDRKRDGGGPTVPKAQTKPRAQSKGEREMSDFRSLLKKHTS